MAEALRPSAFSASQYALSLSLAMGAIDSGINSYNNFNTPQAHDALSDIFQSLGNELNDLGYQYGVQPSGDLKPALGVAPMEKAYSPAPASQLIIGADVKAAIAHGDTIFASKHV